MHYAITGLVTMALWCCTGSLGYTLIMLISYLLSVGILYIAAKLVLKSASYYESLACNNWAVIFFFIFAVILGFLTSLNINVYDVESTSDLVGSIGWLWLTVFFLLPVISMVISIRFVMKAPWLYSVVIAIISTVSGNLFFAFLDKLFGSFA